MRRAPAPVAAAALVAGALVLVPSPPASAAIVAPAPDRVIAGAATGLARPQSIALAPDGRVVVSNLGPAGPNTGSLRMYVATATGNAAAVAVVDSTTQPWLSQPRGLAFGSDGVLRVGYNNDRAIRAFTVPAGGSTVTQTGTPLAGAVELSSVNGLALDASGLVHVAGVAVLSSTETIGKLLVFASPANRVVVTETPMDVAIRGTSAYVTGGNDTTPYVKVFSTGATGPATPSRTIAGPATGLDDVGGVAVDRDGRIYVANGGDDSIRVFAAGAVGDVAPVTVLRGAATQIDYPSDVALDTAGRIWVANDTDAGKVLRFPALTPPAPPRPPAPAPVVSTPSKPRALKVTGATSARKRVVRWKVPARNGGAPILRYRVVVKKGKKVLLVRTVSASRRRLVVKRSKLRQGRLTVAVRAINRKGGGAYAVKSFRVRR